MDHTCSRRAAVLFIFLLLIGVRSVQSQTTASLHGTVSDPNGAVIPDAEVTLSNAEIGITLTTHTDKSGVYQFKEVRPAKYTLTVTAARFSTFRQSGLELLVATPTTNDVTMQISTGVTTVEVTAVLQTVDTSDATIGNAFNQTQLGNLPFEGRDPAGILSLQPGVVTVADRGKVDANGDSRGGAVNGARSDQTTLTLDGVDNNDQVQGNAFVGALRTTLDSIEEFRVTTTN